MSTQQTRDKGREPAPDEAPHRRKRNGAKPWAVQWRVTRGLFASICGEWATIKRYRKQQDAEKALSRYDEQERATWGNGGYRPRESEYRMVAPDGSYIYPEAV